jgi:membrane protease YdiL (CAAX protease family)
MNAEPTPALLAWILGGVVAVDAVLLLITAYRRYVRGTGTLAPRWSVADIWFAIQLILLAMFLLIIPLGFQLMIAGPKNLDLRDLASPLTMFYFLLPATILQNAAFFGVPAAFIVLKYGVRLRDIGLPSLPRRQDRIAGILIGLGAVAISLPLGAGVEALASHFRHIGWVRWALEFEKNNSMAHMLQGLPSMGVAGLILGVLVIGISAPLGEEMLFRGLAFNCIKRRFGLPAGLLLSALLFTLPHAATYTFTLLPVFLMGLLLAWTYQNSGSLWVPILIHATNNSLLVILAYFFPSLT